MHRKSFLPLNLLVITASWNRLIGRRGECVNGCMCERFRDTAAAAVAAVSAAAAAATVSHASLWSRGE